MKKNLLIIVAIFAIAILTGGCSKKVKEYNIDDLLKSYSKVEKSIEKETQYWSDDEKKSKEYVDVVEKYAKKNGFELNQKIIVRGKLESILGGSIFLKASSEKSDSFMCSFAKFKLPSKIALLEPGENITVEGTLFDSGTEKGKPYVSIYFDDCKIKSPSLKEMESIEFNDNISDIITTEYSQNRIMGTVSSVIKIPETVEKRQEMLDNYNSSVNGEFQFVSAYRYGTHSVNFDLSDGKHLMCFVDERNGTLPKEGDKVSLIGEHFTYSGYECVDANESPIYIFKDKENS